MYFDYGREVIKQEIRALEQVAELIDAQFDKAVEAVLDCSGNVIICGVGKPWFIAQKISATLASTGTLSFPLHPADALHGDVGRVRKNDVVILLSNSGKSSEIVSLVSVLKQFEAALIAITGDKNSPLAKASDIVLNLGKIAEACPLGLAPSASSTALLALGDALALAVLKARNFSKEDYARFHPAGALGRKLMRVKDAMRPLEKTPIVSPDAKISDALFLITRLRAGAAYIIDEADKLVGIFTDGDLRRNLATQSDLLEKSIADFITRNPRVIAPDAFISEALKIMKKHRIDELPVVNKRGELLGHLDVQDLLDLGLALE